LKKVSHLTSDPDFDYLIIGGGLAGLQLALAMQEDPFFNHQAIGIFEPSQKNQNDKTWCFWEKGSGKWDHLLYKSWRSGKFISEKRSLNLELGEYRYKMIRSIDFYRYAKKKLSDRKNIRFIPLKVEKVNRLVCHTSKGKFVAGKHIFDSSLSPDFNPNIGNGIQQHFKGKIIESPQAVFKPDTFSMMDFRISFQNHCCFTYVLPFSQKRALVEFTFFSPDLLAEETYDQLIDSYLHEQLGLHQFQTIEEEKGVIPMSDYNFQKDNSSQLTKIGTAGGWVKASSGYSFKSSEKKVQQIIANLKQTRLPSAGLFKSRFLFYDRIFLRILKHKNYLGNRILQEMYYRNKTPEIFKFLDEETDIFEELKIISRFKQAPFLWSLSKEFL